MAQILKINELISFFTALSKYDNAADNTKKIFALDGRMNEKNSELLFECKNSPLCQLCKINHECPEFIK